MRRIGDVFLALNKNMLVIARTEFIIMICANCGLRRSSYVIETKLDKDKWEWLAAKLNQMPKCMCLEVQRGTNSDK